jgi:hypothetical protein
MPEETCLLLRQTIQDIDEIKYMTIIAAAGFVKLKNFIVNALDQAALPSYHQKVPRRGGASTCSTPELSSLKEIGEGRHSPSTALTVILSAPLLRKARGTDGKRRGCGMGWPVGLVAVDFPWTLYVK